MRVASEMPDWQPNRRMYICPGCKTPIPFGTETSAPPDNCPTCRRRLYIPTMMCSEIRAQRGNKPEGTAEHADALLAVATPTGFRKARIIALLPGIAQFALVGFGTSFIGLIVALFLDQKSSTANTLGIGCLLSSVALGFLYALSMIVPM